MRCARFNDGGRFCVGFLNGGPEGFDAIDENFFCRVCQYWASRQFGVVRFVLSPPQIRMSFTTLSNPEYHADSARLGSLYLSEGFAPRNSFFQRSAAAGGITTCRQQSSSMQPGQVSSIENLVELRSSDVTYYHLWRSVESYRL